jgi:large-conductance mechanosensitive channel
VSELEPKHKRSVSSRLVPSAITFVVVAVVIYVCGAIAASLVRHILIPIIAVGVGGYMSVHLYRFLGRH